ncbi:hypothetical protein DH2020_021821 [Rehmannia glutinosa]|uniref:Uncharacterized protein n=1 Tax=Rehmannia glutinosa TaxID=99300 RepID=A0ABR0WDY2_REHGL
MEEIQMSLNALAGEDGLTTMRLFGECGGHMLHILIDSGSTLSFLQEATTRRLGCKLSAVKPLLVKVANGQRLEYLVRMIKNAMVPMLGRDMDAATERIYRNPFLKRFPATSYSDLRSQERKRIKPDTGSGHNNSGSPASWRFQSERKRYYTYSQVVDHSDPFAVNDMLKELDSGKYGSVTKEILELLERRRQLLDSFYAVNPELSSACLDLQNIVTSKTTELATPDVINLDDDQDWGSVAVKMFVPAVQQSHYAGPVVIIDSDDENDARSENFRSSYMEVNLKKPSGNLLMKDFAEWNFVRSQSSRDADSHIAGETKSRKDRNQSSRDAGAHIAGETKSRKDRNQSSRDGDAHISGETEFPKDRSLRSRDADAHIAGETKSRKDRNQSSRDGDAHIAGETEFPKDRSQRSRDADAHIAGETEFPKDKGVYVGTDDDMHEEGNELSDTNSDGLGDIWKEMTVALECSKDAVEDVLLDEYDAEDEEECEHSFILKDDIGDVCRICGVIKRGIETIIEYNFSKSTRNTRTYRHEGRTTREHDQTETLADGGFKSSDIDFTASEIYPHPRHRKEMKPHQIEGFNFLLSNLVTDNPGGCILAHAPGSGKTFMIISFLQSFMAKYPAARPLVVLPRGILATWKKEFIRWQVEDIPLYDFYSVKADSRAQQLEVLKEWVQERSVLFLGYKQFSSIVCDTDGGNIAVACQNYLLKDTDVLTSLERVETPRKVVLSGTLYQNHVKEVFNILNLVQKFLKMETSKAIRRRILSRAEISGKRNLMRHGKDNEFYELIEHTLIKDENRTRKVTVIQDLREMTKKVLHYYKGDNLDELPGLVDFSVFLRLSHRQKAEVEELMKTLSRKFTISAQGSAIYVHPNLKALAKNSGVKDRVDEEKISVLLEKINVREGAKLNFYLNLLQLCESSGEKLLVFSQYLLPLKFLERITAKVKGYSMGKEMFMITGDSDNDTRESSLRTFNQSSEARVFFGSIRACGEGISLVGASRIIILDVHLNPSVTRQAIGRAFRPGQVRKVYTYRLIASDSPEEEDHATCFKKESIAKMWFEWDEVRGRQNLEMETVDVDNCGDMFLETARLKEDVVCVKKR